MRLVATRPGIGILWLALALALTAASGCQGNRATPPVAPTSAPAGKVVFSGTYSQNIQPIFTQKCVACHGPSRAENGLRLDSYEGVMKGTQYGPVVVPGNASASALLSVISGTADPSIQMPHGAQPLSGQDVQNITLWIRAGAPKD